MTRLPASLEPAAPLRETTQIFDRLDVVDSDGRTNAPSVFVPGLVALPVVVHPCGASS